MPPDPSAIPGYDYGTERVSRSPVTLEELARLKNAAGLTEEDHHYLALAGEVLADQAEDMVSAREFLARKGHSPEQIERMQAAWTKAVLLSVALWSRSFTKERLW